jgi:hypothetical protein
MNITNIENTIVSGLDLLAIVFSIFIIVYLLLYFPIINIENTIVSRLGQLTFQIFFLDQAELRDDIAANSGVRIKKKNREHDLRTELRDNIAAISGV